MKKNYTISIPVGLFWKVYVPVGIGLCCLGALAGVLIVDRVVMPKIVGVERDMVEIPALEGVAYEQARDNLLSVGLLAEIRSREFDDTVADGAVIAQYPEHGLQVKKGRRIAVTLSRGKEIAMIPRVRDLTENQARQELRKHGFTVGSARRSYSESQPQDQVIDASPPGGTTISRAMDVDILVSRGPRPTHAEVPNVIGENLADARKQVEESGLKVGRVEYQDSPSLAPGTVISQSVSPGTKAALESSVNLVVSVIR